ncbi:MAG: hypothetical protein ABIQ09_00280 [Jatrophihabitantaceae bacterium]
MPRSQYSSPEPKPLRFRDRTQYLNGIREQMDRMRADPSYLTVFGVVGLGGAGKTRLLTEVHRRISAEERNDLLVWVSLEAESSAHQTGPLLRIREQVGFDCLLFDAALVTFWSVTGQPFQLPDGSRLSKSLAFKALDVTRTASTLATGIPLPLPLTFAADLYRAATHKLARFRHYEKAEFEAIDALRLTPAAIAERLPHFLGEDVRRRLEESRRGLVVFYDAYDRQLQATVASRAPWLREFIGTVNRGLHIIASREPVDWDPRDWQEVMVTVMLDELPERYARYIVHERLGQLPKPIEDRFLSASRRVPFFLEAMVNAYASQSQAGAPIYLNELPSTPRGSVTYLLEHLSPERRVLTVALATLQTFDEGSFRYLVHALNLPISFLEFGSFVQSFFVEKRQPGLYKVHDVLTAIVAESSEDRLVRRTALEAATRHLLTRCRQDVLQTPHTVLALFQATLAGWARLDSVPTASVEELVDVGYVLYDAGYWTELATTAEIPASTDSPVSSVTQFFLALATRRTAGITRGVELFEDLEPVADRLGRHQASLSLEVAYLSELAGNYAKARYEFAMLNEECEPFDVTDRTHIRARLYHADMLIMDGQLRQGAQILLEAAELVGTRTPLDWAELVRHRAHAYRFSYLLEPAIKLYQRALQSAAEAPSLFGKLQTNLVETYCWYEPGLALEAAALSFDWNLRLGNRIELAKCDAARGIALGRLGEFVAAQHMVDRSKAEATEAGYRAGVAMALQASAIVKALQGDAAGSALDLEQLEVAVGSLGTYTHLLVAPAWLGGNQERFRAAAAATDWFDGETLSDRLTSLLGR